MTFFFVCFVLFLIFCSWFLCFPFRYVHWFFEWKFSILFVFITPSLLFSFSLIQAVI
jgi:hypothetical protein